MIGTAYALIVHLYNGKSGAATTSYPVEVNKLAHKCGLGKFALTIPYCAQGWLLPWTSGIWCSLEGGAI